MSNGKRIHMLFAATGMLALAGCETVAEEVNEAVAREYVAMLTAVPGHNGSGKAEISINDTTNQICADLEIDNNTAASVTAAHIHYGRTGPIYVTLDTPDDNDSDDCDTVSDAIVDHMRGNPGAYYVDVHTSTHPGGALRGRLRKE